jgi:hypothetical protein
MTDTDDATKGNPATLGESDKLRFQMRFVDFGLSYGKNTQDTVSDLLAVVADNPSPIDVLQTFGNKFGKQNYAALQIMPFGIRIMQFEMSPFYRVQAQVDPRTPALPELDIQADSRVGMNLAYGFRIGKQLSLGVTVRPMYRNTYHGVMTVAELMDYLPPSDKTMDDLLEARSGLQVGLSTGMVYAYPSGLRLALLVENLGYAGSMSEDDQAPKALPMSVNLGSQYRFRLSKSWLWDFAVDYHDVLDAFETSALQKLRLGTEFGTSYFSRDLDLGLMLGLLDGYGSFGTFVDLWFARLEMAVYSRELGEYPGQRRDLRYAFNLKSSMTF